MFVLTQSTKYERNFNLKFKIINVLFEIKNKCAYFSENSRKFQLTLLSQRNQSANKIKIYT